MAETPAPSTIILEAFRQLEADLARDGVKDADAWQVLGIVAVRALLDAKQALIAVAAAVSAHADVLEKHRLEVEELIAAVDELNPAGKPEEE